jgi:lipoprotein signal peptidase
MLRKFAGRVRAFVAHEVLRLATLVAMLAFLLDWATKSWAEHALSDVAVPFGALVLSVVHNDAFAFSSGAGTFAPELVAGVRLTALLLVVILSRRILVHDRRFACGVALLIAGGFGNAADLLFRNGAVVDFIGAGPFTIGYAGELIDFAIVFNLADVAIVIGLGMITPRIREWALAAQRRIAAWEARWLTGMSRMLNASRPDSAD